MGRVSAYFGRKRSERRIQRRSRRIDQINNRDFNEEFESTIDKYSSKAYNLTKRIFTPSPQRKAEGKELLKGYIKKSIGMTYRGVTGTKKKKR